MGVVSPEMSTAVDRFVFRRSKKFTNPVFIHNMLPLLARQTSRNKPSVISEEKKHLSSDLVSNAYPFSFLQKLTKIGKPNNNAEPANEFKATAVLPYVKGLSEQLRRCLQQQGVRAVFKSETKLRSQLIRPKDAVDPAKQDGVVNRIPCECGKVDRRDWKTYARQTYARQNLGARSRNTTQPYQNFRHFRACPQHRTQATLERS
ncbi:unnamed protein product [Pocillopora meandrina]|uniref:Uncharacterized protein n=1 Tax=Pocillopora meandrina TaxID=46732 RepID=A0AAU9W4E1_9CNID|nr:unnamed protein product [Pocillopora meandrina]